MTLKTFIYTVLVTLHLLAFTSGSKGMYRRFIVDKGPQLCCFCDDTSDAMPNCADVNCRSSGNLCDNFCMAEISVNQSGGLQMKRSCGSVEECVDGFSHTLTKPECFSSNKRQHPGLSCTLCCKKPDDPFARPTYCLGPPESNYDKLTDVITSPISTPKTTLSHTSPTTTPTTASPTTTSSTKSTSTSSPTTSTTTFTTSTTITSTTKSTTTTQTITTTPTSTTSQVTSPPSTQTTMFQTTNGTSSTPDTTSFVTTTHQTTVPTSGNYRSIDGGWGSWQQWGPCSQTCGQGSRSRHRICDSPTPVNGGNGCHGNGRESGACNIQVCPNWSLWFYSPCTATCGTGTRQGVRICSSGHVEDCAGSSMKTEACTDTPCPVDGGWGNWQHWDSCSQTCGGGLRSRSRVCDSPAPAHGGNNCHGNGRESGACNSQGCPHWGPYYQTSACSVTCGEGVIQLARNCSTGYRDNCTGSPYDEKPCSNPVC